MKKLFMYLAVISMTFSVFAQSPQKMSYQCVVRNASGVLVTNQSVGIKISILQGTSTGTVVYQENYNPNPQTNANGLVSIEIGGGTPLAGTFSAINWASGSYFLKTETDPTGGTNYTISGTSQLLSVPYALHAKTAENGFSGNYIDLTNKPILFSGVYNDLTSKPILFDGTWSGLTAKPSFATVATSGSYNDLTNKPALFSGNYDDLTNKPTILGSQWTTSGSNIYYNAGNVGIGTSNPATYIHAHGAPVASRGQLSLSSPAGQGTFISFYEADIFKAYLWFDASDQDLRLQNYTAGDLNLNPYGGNVGIGTNTPGSKLEVAGQIKITGGTPAVGQVLTSDGTGLATWEPPAGNSSHYIGESYGGGIVFYVYDNGQHGLIAATADQSTGIRWYGGSNTNTRARANGVGAGLKNTAIIIANQGPVDGNAFAATVCNEYSVIVGGVTYGDWYLPSKYELNLLYLQKTVVGGFATHYYWSSTEDYYYLAWEQSFTNGSQTNSLKVTTSYVRAIRAF